MRTSIGAYTVLRRLAGGVEAYVARSAMGVDCEIRLYSAPAGVGFEDAQRDLGFCRRFGHETLAAPQAAFIDGSQLAVASEFVEGGSLAELVQRLRTRNERLDGQAVFYAAHRIAEALALAHEHEDEETGSLGMSHGFLSPEVIFVGMDGSVRLTGLGLSSLVGGSGIAPDVGYTAPEQRDGGHVTPRGDVYSLCTILWAIFSDREPTGRNLDVATLGDVVSPEMRADLRRGLAEKLSDRKLTAMELEQSFGAASDDAGRAALAHAMNTAGSRSSAPAPDSTPAPPPLRTAPRSAGAPPMRSKKATLLGTPRPNLGLDEPGAAIAAPVTPDPAQFAPGLKDLNLVSLDHTIALEGNVTVAESPASVPVPALDWGSEEPTTIQPRAALDAEVAAREAEAGPFADEATQQSARDGAVPPAAAVGDAALDATMALDSSELDMEFDVDEDAPISSSDFQATLAYNAADVGVMVQEAPSDEAVPAAVETELSNNGFDDNMEEVLGVVDLHKIADGDESESKDSPWGDSAPSEETSSAVGWGKLLGIGLLTAIVVMGIGVSLALRGSSVTPPPADPSADLAGIAGADQAPSAAGQQPDPSASPS
ncbi:MAG: protein kinase, partial [Polyangiaceae bacterium]